MRQAKLPVNDLRASTDWYRRALDLELAAEFHEAGVLRGVALADRETGIVVALRERTAVPGAPSVEGLDVFALEVDAPESLHALVARWDEFGIEHTAILDSGPYGLGVDALDPDGIHGRFLCGNPIGQGGFHGFDFTDAGPAVYDVPRSL
ncbi:VOC family protein [Kribbella sp. NPDC004536]|uniref:VOC family protein n=1 Tax=Kribbella sp. NPDC004536 TaxID=3364106 RepID=UPI0036867720